MLPPADSHRERTTAARSLGVSISDLIASGRNVKNTTYLDMG